MQARRLARLGQQHSLVGGRLITGMAINNPPSRARAYQLGVDARGAAPGQASRPISAAVPRSLQPVVGRRANLADRGQRLEQRQYEIHTPQALARPTR